MKEYIKTHDPAKKKDVICGYTEGGVYYREVTNDHYMVKHKGYGIQKDILQKLLNKNIKDVVIITQAGTVHKASLRAWLTKGKSGNYAHGDQIFLDISNMSAGKK